MSTKRYTSKSCLSLNVVLRSGHSLHLQFSGLTGGGSVYYTDSEEIQEGLRRHRYFGGMFREEDVTDEPAAEEPSAEEPEQENTVNVSSLEEAKEYLSDRFGVSRTKMKGAEGVKRAAAAHGVVFSGI